MSHGTADNGEILIADALARAARIQSAVEHLGAVLQHGLTGGALNAASLGPAEQAACLDLADKMARVASVSGGLFHRLVAVAEGAAVVSSISVADVLPVFASEEPLVVPDAVVDTIGLGSAEPLVAKPLVPVAKQPPQTPTPSPARPRPALAPTRVSLPTPARTPGPAEVLAPRPTELSELVAWTVERVLSKTRKRMVPVAFLIREAFDTAALPRGQFNAFMSVVIQDPRVDQISGSSLLFHAAAVPKTAPTTPESTVVPGRATARSTYPQGAVEGVIRAMRTGRRISYRPTQLARFAASYGAHVPEEMLDDFVDHLLAQPGVVQLEDGRLAAKGEPSAAEMGVQSFQKVYRGDNGAPMDSRQIRRAIDEIDSTPELRRARSLMSGVATRSKGRVPRSSSPHGSKASQGRSHGHTLTFEERLQQMNRDNGDVQDR